MLICKITILLIITGFDFFQRDCILLASKASGVIINASNINGIEKGFYGKACIIEGTFIAL